MSDKKYSIKADRKFTELAIANALINKPNLCNEIDESKLKLENVRMIHRFISASIKRGDSLSPEVIKSHLRANIGNTASPETHQTISEICTERNVVDNEFKSLKNHLNQISTRENVVRLGESIVDRAVGGDDLLEICQIAEHITDAKSNLAGKFEVTSLGQAMDMTMNNMVKDRESDVTSSFEFHIKRLNKLIGGMFATDLIVVAARPAVGKTAFGLNIIYHQPEAAYGVISSEMSTEQLSKRMIATETGIDSFKLRRPKLLSEPEFAEVGIAASKLKGRRVYIEDKGNINISEIRERIQEWVSIYGVNVVLVDYIQRIDSDRRHSNKAEEVGYVAKRLKEIAKEFGICIVALAQINRDAQKDNRPPTMADIKASGDIEQEADIIIILHKQSMGTDDANFDCIVEGIVEKNRHGRIGTVLMNYAPSRIDFSDASDEQIDNYILGEAA